ncbi:amidohydrolase family protein [Paraburkholderia jirisanensis]
MRIIDSQVHIWDAVPAAFAAANPEEPASFTYQNLLAAMDEAGVDKAILVPRSFNGARNDYVLEALRAHPDRFAVMGRVPLNEHEGKPLLANWKAEPGVLGVRLTFHRDGNRPHLTDGSMDWFWPEAERHQIPAMVHAPERLPEIGQIAARYPGLTLIIDHLGFARATIDAATGPAVERLVQLARHPNVHVKVSTMPAYSTAPYPYENLREPIRRVIDAFGVERCFWGSDMTRLPEGSSYRKSVTMFTEQSSFVTKDELTELMGAGLARVLGWPKSL